MINADFIEANDQPKRTKGNQKFLLKELIEN